MHDYSDLAFSVEGTYLILVIIYLVFLILSILRWKVLYFQLDCKKGLMVMIFYTFLMVHCVTRLVCFLVSFITVNNCEQAKFSTSFASQNVYLLFMMFFPDITFLICLLILYFVLACVIFFGHIRFLVPDQIKIMKKTAKFVWCAIILSYFVLQVSIIILFSRDVIDKQGVVISFSVNDIIFPCFILLSEYKLHQKTSGLPYESSIFRNTKNNLNFRVFYWIICRFCHAILCLILLKVDDMNNFVELPQKSSQIENYTYFMGLGSLAIVFVDKIVTEVVPIYLVVNQDFMDLFRDMKNKVKESLLQKTDTEDRCDLNFGSEFNGKTHDGKIAFDLINFEPLDQSGSQQKGNKNKSFGALRKATCSLINQNSFLGLEELSVRVVELANLSPYIIESVVKDYEIHQNIQKITNLVNLNGISIEKNKIALIYTQMPNGSLHTLINVDRKNDPLKKIDYNMKLKIGLKMAKTLKVLHSHNPPIIHGHLTPNNILLDKDFTPKIGDILFYDLKKYCAVVIGYQNKTKYTAPEHLKENGGISNNPKTSADVYSYGLIMWELITETQAFQNMKMADLKKIIIEDDSRPKIPEDVPEEIAKIIRCCWQNDAEKRPTFDQILDKLEAIIGDQDTFESFVINGEMN